MQDSVGGRCDAGTVAFATKERTEGARLMNRRSIGLLGLAVVAMSLASRSKSSPSSSASSTSEVPTTVTTSTGRGMTTSTSETTTSVSETTTTLGTPNCTFAQLGITASGNSGMGHIGIVLVFKNTSAQTCKLIGYPGVAGLNAAGTQVIQAKRTLNGYMHVLPAGQGPPVVTLTTGQSASAFVEGTDVPQGNAACATYPKLLVTPPNTTQSVTIDAAMPGCSPVQVHPVVPGTTGSIVV